MRIPQALFVAQHMLRRPVSNTVGRGYLGGSIAQFPLQCAMAFSKDVYEPRKERDTPGLPGGAS